ncbi:SAM-dependent methyltransferase [Syntrophorhabdus aromaticivorans]|uniref:Class I SAM-dependent methyltransferase n=1 Tax=Syntrophorhabdus aromaticivorans TaxID=328301 RepID=A0A351U1F1_9BACT|nr:cyclopropane-fatty-acyl-phospholipid synthase family protein [Syntrophorhabdus aromaticivorans]NLW35767.1 class I SAM-dependent methyltransferase [Syntrophorhabdus aromaticivorans]HBA53782.1 class I SAM-dependent methyltransferase [Syntrophorhabdus aromaticivorans]
MKKALEGVLRSLNTSMPNIPFIVRFWDGDVWTFGENIPSFTLIFKRKEAVKNILAKGTLGFGEEYAAGHIDVEGDFRQLVRLGVDSCVRGMKLSLGAKTAALFHHLASLNTLGKSPKNIAHHYDLGNDFYKQYLDESMTYSCAYFRSTEDTLEDAQKQKYEHICRKLQLKEGEALVDIGCGWGGMLLYAARHYGIKGVGCTLSPHQADYAKQKVAEEGLTGNITILREDYRSIAGRFDKLVSIGMFEHVGKSFIPTFMEKMRALLKPGGIGLLHTIGKECRTGQDPWTMKHIFPGGHIPILDYVIRTMGKKGLVPVDIENLRLHYAATLDEWARRFELKTEKIERMFDSRLVRTWRMFLCGSAAAFRWADLRLYQILFTNGLNNSLPLTREYLYRT